MKKTLLILITFFASSVFSQTLPFDFESPITGMTGYDNATFSVVANPNTIGNGSANVGEIVKVAGDQFAGGKVTGVTSLDFSNLSSSVLSMKVYTTQPAGTIIRIKLENPFSGEVDAVTTTSGAWETLTFNFGPQASIGSADLVIMPQPYTTGGGNTFYFDDIEQIAGTAAPTPLTSLPIDFESSVTDDHFEDFQSAFLTVVPNPQVDADNSSTTVGKIIRYLGAPFGGSKITFANNFDFSTETKISMKVLTSAPIGTYVTLKTEKIGWGVEKSVQTTKSGEWETLIFDFTGEPNDMPTLTFLFDFTAGSTNTGDGTANSTFFFDDIGQNDGTASVPINKELKFSLFPNPTSDILTIQSESRFEEITIYDISGATVYNTQASEKTISIDLSKLNSGVYFLEANFNGELQRKRIMKE
jgi:hypothetical protein